MGFRREANQCLICVRFVSELTIDVSDKRLLLRTSLLANPEAYRYRSNHNGTMTFVFCSVIVVISCDGTNAVEIEGGQSQKVEGAPPLAPSRRPIWGPQWSNGVHRAASIDHLARRGGVEGDPNSVALSL